MLLEVQHSANPNPKWDTIVMQRHTVRDHGARRP